MTAGDVAAGLHLCRASGWNQLAGDWQVFLDWNPPRCRVAERDGKVIGTVASLRYGECFSWLSMVLVDPQERGSGVGTRLLQEGLDMLGEDCARLDATALGRPIYARSGFIDEYPITRMMTNVDASAFTGAKSTRLMKAEDLPAVLSYDRVVFGADRGRLLLRLFEVAPAYAWIAEGASNLQGFCLGRPGFLYQQIGPLVAHDDRIAQDLLAACLHSQGGKKFAVDIPEFRPEWLSWLTARGFSTARSFVRMRRGDNTCLGQPERMYAIVGPEFG
ncbi:MAG: GNAT family N-acetyltransferase [Acidobacteriota bacterium]|nr:GNAT family N-acetyltransferase [Acidobacteriota bacterium]